MIVPQRLLIEVTNKCNASCTYCLRSQMKRKVYDLPLQDFKRWVKSAPYAEWVQPQGIGEPLIYPHIVEALAYAKRLHRKTMFYTNASLLTRELSEQLLGCELDDLTFSVDGFNESTFQTRHGLSWSKVLRNIITFQQMKIQGGYSTHTKIRGTITDKNKHHMLQFYLFWRDKVDTVAMMPQVKFPARDSIDHMPYTSGNGFRCYHIFDPEPRPLTPAITILNNGNVVVCCQDWFSDYVMGNLYESTILDVFNSGAYNQLRHGMMTGRKYPVLCEYCRLGKLGKTHRAKPSTLLWRGINKLQPLLASVPL